MTDPAPLASPITADLADLAATRALGGRLGRTLRPGDAVLLTGDLGAGKSELARAALRAALEDPDLSVPSPTFTLIQSYAAPAGFEILHVDLYRLEDPQEVVELGLEEAFAESACLIEWPDRLGPHAPAGALSLMLESLGEDEDAPRRLTVVAAGPDWAGRLEELIG